jgi:hypothetical protein
MSGFNPNPFAFWFGEGNPFDPATLPTGVGASYPGLVVTNVTDGTQVNYLFYVFAAGAMLIGIASDGTFNVFDALGVLQVGFNALGQFLAAGGNWILDATGLTITGVQFIENHTATIGAYARRARRGFQELSSKPAYLIEFIDDAVAANLITINADIETGSLATGYSAYTNWSADNVHPHAGVYSAKIEMSNANALTTNKYAVTAGTSYRVTYWADMDFNAGEVLTGQAKWYNAVPTLLKTDTINASNEKYGYHQRRVTLLAPAGATQLELNLYLSTTGAAGHYCWVDDLVVEAITEYAALRLSDSGVDLMDEFGVIASFSAGKMDGIATKAPSGTGAITATEAYWQWHTTRKILSLYDGQRERALSAMGWLPYAYQIGGGPADVSASGTNLALNGGVMATPVNLTASMLLESVSCWNGDTSLARGWNWTLYEQYLNNGNAGENTLTCVAYGTAAEVFTPGAASLRTIDAASKPAYLPPGLYWLCIQNTNTSRTFGLGGVGVGTMGLNTSQYKTLAIPLGATLDFVAATWSTAGKVYLVRLNGRVFGQTTSF